MSKSVNNGLDSQPLVFTERISGLNCHLFPADDNAMMGMSSSSGAAKAPSKESKPPLDNVERRSNALAALKLICESQVFAPHLEALLAMQDAQVRVAIEC